jgi:2-methylisocitrate lyase-like PEP mutase family enzyme
LFLRKQTRGTDKRQREAHKSRAHIRSFYRVGYARSVNTKADILRRVHQGPAILVLPNAWHVAGARIFERAGFPALGTTSAGIAFALEYPGGQHVSRAEMIEVVARIARALKIPATADVEAGYDNAVETARPGMDRGRRENESGRHRRRRSFGLFGARRGDRAVERLNAYRDAGADCLFAPGAQDCGGQSAFVRRKTRLYRRDSCRNTT